ncbi:MAG TPA: hypothetical protein PLB33_05700, partial [Sedimentibacter sp.]|nr:hypothetical protein [Sedimentibacter sp.]
RRNDGIETTYVNGSGGATDNWDSNIMAWPKPESGTAFSLDYTTDDKYTVEWDVTKGSFLDGRTITVTEGVSGYTHPTTPTTP